MSRRTDLVEMFLQSDEFGEDKKVAQALLSLMGEQVLTQMISIAINGFEKKGAGSLFINLIEPDNEAVYLNGDEIQAELLQAESFEDEETVKFLRKVLEQVDNNDWNHNVVFTYLTPDGTRTYSVEIGGSQESFRAITSEFTG
tara:strand:- start:6488 stop:6916 length:429 start_codon:yes stop_codon:yes gene_type:complete